MLISMGLPHSLVRIPSNQFGKNVLISVFERELKVVRLGTVDFAQKVEELLLAFHHFGKASPARGGERP